MPDPSPIDPAKPAPADSTPYELEPPAPTPPPPPPPAGKPHLAAEPVLSGVDEDDDFEHDPQVQQALNKKPSPKPSSSKSSKHAPKPAATDDADPESLPFVKPGFGNAQAWALLGAFLLVGAVIAAAINSPKPFAMSLLVLYSGVLHVGTGLAAVWVSAKLASQPVGQVELAGARMMVCVGAFLLILNLNIQLIGTSKIEELILATLAYLAALAGLFRLWGRDLGILAGTHFLFWVIVELGMQLSAWANSAIPLTAGAPHG